MKRTRLLLWVLLLVGSLLATAAHATNYYVSTSGKDSNPGTLERPFRTIQRAANRMSAGDVCYIRKGSYHEQVKIYTSRLTFKNYNGEYVEVTGLKEVKNWKKHKGDIYKAYFKPEDLGNQLSQVLVNNQVMHLARYPNYSGDLLDWRNHGTNVKTYRNSNGKVTVEGMSKPNNYWKGGIFHGIVERKWTAIQGLISSSSGNAIVCNQRTSGWKANKAPYFHDDGVGLGKGFITNHLNALDVQKEWHWENNTLYLYAPGGADPNKLMVLAKSRRYGFVLNGRTGVKIEGIAFKATGLSMYHTYDCTITKCSFKYPVSFYRYYDRDDYTPLSAISIDDGARNTISDCSISDSWGSGAHIKGNSNVMKNCVVEDVNWMGTYNACVRAGDNTELTRNTFRKSGRFLVYGSSLKGGKITYNHMYDGLLLGQDGGAFYTTRSDTKGTEIAYNWIHDIKGIEYENAWDGRIITAGIYADHGAHNFNIHHNVIWNTLYGVSMTPSSSTVSRNNNIYHNTCWVESTAIRSLAQKDRYANNKIYNNLSNHEIDYVGQQKGNVTGEVAPSRHFLDIGNKDFRLQSFSKAIDAGVPSSFSANVRGSAPDAGAYEYQSNWVAGANAVSSSPAPSSSPAQPYADITGISLVDENTHLPVFGYDDIPNGAVLDQATLNTIKRINVFAQVEGTFESVIFEFNGIKNYRREHIIPYALQGNGDYYQTLKFKAQTHTIKVNVYSGRNGEGTLLASKTFTFKVVKNNASQSVNIAMEAECASRGGKWKAYGSTVASEGKYVVSWSNSVVNPPSNPDARMVFDVDIPRMGNYHLWAHARAGSGADDSFWLRVNGGKWVEWFITVHNKFVWDKAPDNPWVLVAGKNRIEIAYRESGTHLDKIFISDKGSEPTNVTAINRCNNSARQSTSGKQSLLEKETFEQDQEIHLFPNPVEQQLFIKASTLSSTASAQILDITGRVISTHSLQLREAYQESTPSMANYAIETKNLPAGVYILQLFSEDRIVSQKRFAKKQ